MVGRITSVSSRPANPIGQWINMPVNGCVSGCAPNIKCRGRRPGSFLQPALTIGLVLSGSLSGRAAFRERYREVSSGSRMREARLSGSTSGMWKRSMVRIMRHRLTKGPETDRPSLNHRATSRLYRSIRRSDRPGGTSSSGICCATTVTFWNGPDQMEAAPGDDLSLLNHRPWILLPLVI